MQTKKKTLIILSVFLFLNVEYVGLKTHAQDENLLRSFDSISEISPSLNKTSGELIISKWNNEVEFRIKTLDIPLSSDIQNGKDVLTYQNYKAQIYEIALGMEYEIIFENRPLSNIFEFQIKSRGLEFYYQAPLSDYVYSKGWVVNATHAYDENGTLRNYRPIDIVGSYAIYGLKYNNIYKTGKVGHIYRPLVYDSRGSKIYGDMRINDNILSITIPNEWLDRAIPPITIDPTFGKTDIGGSSWHDWGNRVTVSNFTLTEEGNITGMHVYLKTGTNAYTKDGAFYNNSGSDPDYKQVAFNAVNYTGNIPCWVNYTATTPTVLSSGMYYLGLGGSSSGAGRIAYDSSGGNDRMWRSNFDVGVPNNNWAGTDITNTNIISAYADYSLTIQYYLTVENLSLSSLIGGDNVTLSVDLETNSNPDNHWYTHNMSGEWITLSVRDWSVNGTVYNSLWVYGIRFGIEVIANSTHVSNSTGILYFDVSPCTGGQYIYIESKPSFPTWLLAIILIVITAVIVFGVVNR